MGEFPLIWGQVLQPNNCGGKYLRGLEGGAEFAAVRVAVGEEVGGPRQLDLAYSGLAKVSPNCSENPAEFRQRSHLPGQPPTP